MIRVLLADDQALRGQVASLASSQLSTHDGPFWHPQGYRPNRRHPARPIPTLPQRP
jgi:hypothetical protein